MQMKIKVSGRYKKMNILLTQIESRIFHEYVHVFYVKIIAYLRSSCTNTYFK